MNITQNSLTYQLAQALRYEQNGLAIFNAFLEAITTNEDSVTVVLDLDNGQTVDVSIPSNNALGAELQRLKQSVLNLGGLLDDKQNVIVSLDDASSFREIFATNYKRAYDAALRNEIAVNNRIAISESELIQRMITPMTSVELTLPSKYIRAERARVTKFILHNADDLIEFTEGESYSTALLKLNNLTQTRIEFNIDFKNRQARYYGNFNVLLVKPNTAALTIDIQLESLAYSDIQNTVENSRELNIGDRLVSNNGQTQLRITAINAQTKTITCVFEAGYDAINPGINALSYLYIDTDETRTMRVPLKLNEKALVFISVVDPRTNVESAYSDLIILDSDTFEVVENNIIYTFNEYFQSRVVDIGAYFSALIKENQIPASLGLKPVAPNILATNFKVVQINTHLTDKPNAARLQKLSKEKRTISSRIDKLSDEIAKLNARIAEGNYKSVDDRAKDEAERSEKITEKSEQSQLFNSVVQDINSTVNTTSEQASSPKYRIRGFWEIAADLDGTTTGPQKIVQYIYRYRYVSPNSDAANAQAIDFSDSEDNTTSASFSPWIEVATKALTKQFNDNGLLEWATNNTEDANEQNINQLDIPIRAGESVQIQIRAVSEAGYPTAPLMSNWSNTIRINFPDELLIGSDLATISSENENDLLLSQIRAEFSSQGITRHVANSITEQNRYFAHSAEEISSGQRSSDGQEVISVATLLQTMQQQITELAARLDRRTAILTVEIIAPNGTLYTVNRSSTLNLFAGYYSNAVNLNDESQFGAIVEKEFYLRLTNNESGTIDLQSISIGALNALTTIDDYVRSPLSINGEPAEQLNGQIIYVRNIDQSGSTALYKEDLIGSATEMLDDDVNNAASAIEQVLVERDNGGNFNLIAPKEQAAFDNYVVIRRTHPIYTAYEANQTAQTLADLNEEFDRIAKLSYIDREDIVQRQYQSGYPVEYIANDKYLAGKNSVGAKLFVRFADQSAIQVNGSDGASNFEVKVGQANAILIPIVMQFRMSDALGNPNGDSTLNTNTNFTYVKKLGIDALIGGSIFKFDVNITAKYRVTAVSNEDLNVQQLRANYDVVSSTTPKIL